MDDAQRAAVEVLGLSDAQHAAYDEAMESALGDRLAEALDGTVPLPAPGEASPATLPAVLAIGVPSRWEAERANELSVLFAMRTTGLRDWQVKAQLNARLVVTSLDDGRTWTRRMGGTHKRTREPAPSMSGRPPSGSAASAYGSEVSRIARALDGLRSTWTPGRYAITAMNFDWVSNTVELRLTGAASPETARTPVSASPRLIEQRDAAPQDHGVLFRMPERVAAADPIVVRAAVALPTDRLVLAPLRDQPEVSVALGTLLLVRLDVETPAQVDLAIPVRVEPGNPKVTKAFSFDARSAADAPLEPGDYRAYLVFGNTVSGPQPLRID